MLLQPARRLAAFDNGANDRRQAILQVRFGALSQRWQLPLGMLGTVKHGSHTLEFGTRRGNQLTDFIDRRHTRQLGLPVHDFDDNVVNHTDRPTRVPSRPGPRLRTAGRTTLKAQAAPTRYRPPGHRR